MATMIVPCPHCSKGAQLNPDKLPDQPVSYPCPHCQEKVVIDKRQLLQQQTPRPAAPATPAPAAPSSSSPVSLDSTAPINRRFVTPPEGTVFPAGIVLGDDDAAVEQVRQAMAALGTELEKIASAEDARELAIHEQPVLCFYVAGQATAPPHEPMMPMTGLPAQYRRRLFLVLVADNVKTLDGNAAFLYQVNMVLQRADLPQLDAALYSGLEFHQRLYKPYVEASEKVGSI